MVEAEAPVLVLGMHRSGTSLVASILSRLGLDFGPADRLMPAKDDNPEGFWENLDVVQCNDDLLAAMGGSWIDPPMLRDGWEQRAEFEEFRMRARELLAGWGSSERLAFKDPRLSITLPLWLTVIGQPRTVLVLRSPRRVAESLAAREPIAVEPAEQLWLRYTASALHVAPESVVVDYETLIASPDKEIGRLAQALAIDHPIEHAREAINADLHHHRSLPDEPTSSAESWYRLLRDQPNLAARLGSLLHAGNLAVYENAGVREVLQSHPGFGPNDSVFASVASTVLALEDVLRQRESALDHRDEVLSERDAARQALAAMTEERAEVAEIRRAYSERAQILERERDEARQANESMTEQRDRAMKTLEQERTDAKARFAVLEAERSAARRQREEAQQERDRLAEELRNAESGLRKARQAVTTLVASVERKVAAVVRRGSLRG